MRARRCRIGLNQEGTTGGDTFSMGGGCEWETLETDTSSMADGRGWVMLDGNKRSDGNGMWINQCVVLAGWKQRILEVFSFFYLTNWVGHMGRQVVEG